MKPYIGRFAPSPSGPLHFGSIIAALGSFLDAKKAGGKWLVRIDDLDPPRVLPGASDGILRTLELLGLHFDDRVLYQSERLEAYQAALDMLQRQELLYPCICPRSIVKGKVYPGTCRSLTVAPSQQHALRIKTTDKEISLRDRLQGEYSQSLAQASGDFIVRRADGLNSYHLAVVVDDNWQGVTHVVRGADLLDATPSQIYLQNLLGLPTPSYTHLPVAVLPSGKKISKQHAAEDVLLARHPARVLFEALKFLGQGPLKELERAAVADVITWGIENWQLSRVPREMAPVAR